MYGIPCGRDAIFLDEIKVDYSSSSAVFIGQFNGHLFDDNYIDGYIDYVLEFTGIYIYRMTELDLSYDLVDIKNEGSSFFEVKNSKLIEHAKNERNEDLRHFILRTYDDVFEIVCRDYRLDVNHKPNIPDKS